MGRHTDAALAPLPVDTEHGDVPAVREVAVPGHPVAAPEEARAEHVVGPSPRHRLEHAREVGRVVLAVAVEIDRGRVAVLARVRQPGAERRAQAVANTIIADGVDEARVTTKGYGSSQPVAENTTAAGKAANRRVEVAIFANEKMQKAAKKGQL